MRLLSGLVLAFSLTGCAALTNPSKSVEPADVLKTYSDIAEAGYTDSVILAQELRTKIQALLNNPTQETLQAARTAWIASRTPYQQTEVYRFGNAIVDDWEGKVNAWPLDEGLIDYVDSSSYGTESDENLFYTANVIANTRLRLGNQTLDTTKITAKLLAETLHEADENEANVATGYHAIEFLLWGQDLYGNEVGSGERPATDYSLNNCTGGNCDRRRDYLTVVTDLLISDLKEMAANWQEGGAARAELAAKGTDGGLATILVGMGSLSYGELAGERTKLPLMLHDPEEEHDCFSDNTHNSHYYDVLGIRNVYLAEYTRIDGSKVTGPSLADLVKTKDAALDAQLRTALNASVNAASNVVKAAEKGSPFDVLIAAGNKEGNALVQGLVNGLTTQTRSIEAAMSLLGLENTGLEGSDSLDNPANVM
ncbi:MAG TPA: imelysin family protein [Marinospirillum sp.]|uniref:imelysin family protein n=1 Tax=Marinospirillum sp. TaxID=2183934 RepID=UPI002B48493D|nr:imelysin family protein [Marinospirillum sp.]HKM14502.1 imelysin family protein [Marinospirillum sp.]